MRRLLLLVPLLLSAAPASFTVPAPAPRTQTLRLAILGDFNGPYGSTSYPGALGRSIERIVTRWRPDGVLSAGDLIAGQRAALSDARVRAMWAAFERDVRLPLQHAGIGFVSALGNHDASPAQPRDRREAQRYWRAHVPALAYTDRAHFPFRFSFTLGAGQVFVAVLDASGPEVDAAQRAWLSAQLASAPARAAGVRLVVGHLPLAGVSHDKNRPGEVIREAAEVRRIMEAGGVLVYISGHHAAYFPGRLGGLNVLASGGIGGRDYLGHPGTARSTLTLLTVDPAQHRATFETLDAETGAVIPTDTLPIRLSGLGGPVERVSEFR